MTTDGAAGDETLAAVGEFAAIARVVAGRRQPPGVLLGPGDDAAVVTAPDGRTVISTDMLVQDRHFRLQWSAPHDIGRKAVAQNAADIAAMGAVPTAFVVAFGAPPDTPLDRAAELADGLWAEAGRLGAGVVGGDMVAAPCWVVSVTVLGDLQGRPPVRRDGARPGDLVAVAGELGRSAAGLWLWHNGIEAFPELRRRHLVPEPPYRQGPAAAAAGARAMTDVSDGLVADLTHVAEASGVTIELSTAALAADHDAVAATGADAWACVLGGGEDHALVATFPADPPPGWRVIGRVAAGPGRVLVDGAPWTGPAGWQSYDR
ncbi:thiamine-phosphate kinase [uncultured Mycolicibacterium sp.]|uniref:thiamine-phosphate kinase n=1 Tax=uncultured Mycolicibacterium sp. TaxID=2320817 RepID=UPI00260FE60E|nr:thiamine-phosphate kinase [uncultured Mycolicibacterium sp.]